MKPILRSGSMILLFAIFCESTPSFGQSSSMNEAARIVWLEKNPQVSGSIDFQFDRITRQGELVIYERFKPASFVILIPTKVGYNLVGYSSDNLFFGGNAGQSDQPKLLEALATAKNLDFDRLKGTRTLDGSIGPLLTTQWGQADYFNYYCPGDARGPNGRVYVGCVAVAMGQVVRYYGSFNTINLQETYNTGFYGTLSAQIGPYSWSAMDDAPISVNLELSDFLYDLGVLLHMSYGPSGSLTNSHRTLEAFHELGYIGGVIMRKSKFTMESWTEMFYQNLSEYKPVMVTGGGHAFICDGYNEDGLFHFNLGWDGYGDGYYPLTCVMSLPVNEAFTDLEPVSWPEPPVRIGLKLINHETFVTWGYDSDQHPARSKVYADDKLFLETTDTTFNINQLSPGTHQVFVSAVYPDGESRWIGPVKAFVRGALLPVNDPMLYAIYQLALSYDISNPNDLKLYEGDLSRITSLDIDQPVSSMEGLGLCNHLKRLVVHGLPGPAIDAGPLEDLSGLRVLEWNGREIIHPEVMGSLKQLSELRIRQTLIDSLGFLNGFEHLLKFEYSGADIGNYDVLTRIPLLDELILSRTNLAEAGFVSQMIQLRRLDLSGNHLTETGFLSTLSKLEEADISDNQIPKLLLTDQLQSLRRLDVSGSGITSLAIAAELNLLDYLDLSCNQLVTPGRLMLYTPALTELDLSNNRLRDMGKQRCQKLEILDVSDNLLLTTEWITLQPSLKKLNLEHNLISDLSGLLKNNLFRQMNFLGLDRNPLSRQSFNEMLPILAEGVDFISKPKACQPLSPCYLSPVNGSRLVGQEIEFKWVADNSQEKCVYDIYLLQGDSLIPFVEGLDSCNVKLNKLPASAFSWAVGSRTADSVFYSGINDVVSTAEWTLPFIDGFETYVEGEPISPQSDYWYITGESTDPGHSAEIVSSNCHTGCNSLELENTEAAILSAEHHNLPYISIKFSVMIPSGQHGVFRLQNMNGMYFRLAWDETNIGRFYFNEKLWCTFPVDHQCWTDYEIMGHARNNNFHVKAGKQLLINEPWNVPEGIICTESIQFTSESDDPFTDNTNNRIFIDDIKITSAPGTSDVICDIIESEPVLVFPNPFNDRVCLSFPQSGRYNISIIDMSGNEVYTQLIDAAADEKKAISLIDLSAGVYALYTGAMNSRPVKIIKN